MKAKHIKNSLAILGFASILAAPWLMGSGLQVANETTGHVWPTLIGGRNTGQIQFHTFANWMLWILMWLGGIVLLSFAGKIASCIEKFVQVKNS